MTARSPSLERTTVADVMHRGVVTCSPTTSLVTVAREMAAHRIHCVVVRTQDTDALWGVVSDLDLVAAAALGFTDGDAGACSGDAGDPHPSPLPSPLFPPPFSLLPPFLFFFWDRPCRRTSPRRPSY